MFPMRHRFDPLEEALVAAAMWAGGLIVAAVLFALSLWVFGG